MLQHYGNVRGIPPETAGRKCNSRSGRKPWAVVKRGKRAMTETADTKGKFDRKKGGAPLSSNLFQVIPLIFHHSHIAVHQ